jgi:hypothetical protein
VSPGCHLAGCKGTARTLETAAAAPATSPTPDAEDVDAAPPPADALVEAGADHLDAPVEADAGSPPCVSDCWLRTAKTGLRNREFPVGAWTGARALFVMGWVSASFHWRMDTGSVAYQPSTDGWSKAADPPVFGYESGAPRDAMRALWTGTDLLLAVRSQVFSYHPPANEWSSSSIGPCNLGDQLYGFVLVGGRAVLWGGPCLWLDGYCGAQFDPAADSWTLLEPNDSALCTSSPVVLSLGAKLFVWGGLTADAGAPATSGAVFEPGTGTWASVTSAGAPSPRMDAIGAWTGSEVIVWGGWRGSECLTDGAIYDPSQDRWRPMASNDALRCAVPGLSAWGEGRLLVYASPGTSPHGGIYDPGTDTWAPMSEVNIPELSHATAVWAGTEMVFWGGIGYEDDAPGWIYRPPKK